MKGPVKYMPADRAVILRVDGTRDPVTPKNGTDFDLDELQAIVGGWVQVLYLGAWLLCINEEGKFEHLPRNPAATNLALSSLAVDDFIVGDALWCPRSMIK